MELAEQLESQWITDSSLPEVLVVSKTEMARFHRLSSNFIKSIYLTDSGSTVFVLSVFGHTIYMTHDPSFTPPASPTPTKGSTRRKRRKG